MKRVARNSYAQIEKELLAVVFTLDRFDSYVNGRRITVETDHKPLITIAKKALATAPKRLQLILLRLQRYDFDLIYRPGPQMLIAHTLSLACADVTNRLNASSRFCKELAALGDEAADELKFVASQQTTDMIIRAAENNSRYVLLKQHVMTGWSESPHDLPDDLKELAAFADELAVSDELLFKGQCVVVSRDAHFILDRLHSNHKGINGYIRRARETVFYPGLTKDIKQLIAKCEVCLMH